MTFEGISDEADVAVLGAGPAGLALGAALARRGARVACVAPQPRARWTANYGVWLHDLAPSLALACVRNVWTKPHVRIDDSTQLELRRAYGRFDNDTLQDHFLDLLERGGGRVVHARAHGIEHTRSGARVALDDGSVLHPAVVVDATGAGPSFVRRPQRDVAFQSAYGELLRVDRHSFPPNEMTLMDFRGPDAPPTFLYAMPLANDLLFVEETSLVSRTPVSHALLRKRLHDRMQHMNIRGAVVKREICLIPMGTGIPTPQRVVAFGASAAFVHPATGYQIARALRLAEPTAGALLDGIDEGGPHEGAARAYATMWPARSRRAWRMYALGMDVLAGFDGEQLRSFMSAFFALPTSQWSGFMSGSLTTTTILTAMARVFVNARPAMRRSLLHATGSQPMGALWREMFLGRAS